MPARGVWTGREAEDAGAVFFALLISKDFWQEFGIISHLIAPYKFNYDVQIPIKASFHQFYMKIVRLARLETADLLVRLFLSSGHYTDVGFGSEQLFQLFYTRLGIYYDIQNATWVFARSKEKYSCMRMRLQAVIHIHSFPVADTDFSFKMRGEGKRVADPKWWIIGGFHHLKLKYSVHRHY